MKGIKAKMNIDKLTLCYTAPSEVYEELRNTQFIDYDTFQLVRYDDPDKLFTDSFIIKTKDIDEANSGLKWIVFAYLKFNMKLSDGFDKNYVWIYVNNCTLYRPLYPDVSIICELEYMTELLGLRINNVTALEIACDSNINWAKRIKRAIFDPKLSVMLNGILRRERKKVLDEILYITKGNQERMTELSIYVKQKKKNGLELCFYNKTKEAIKSNKLYILDWMNTQQNIFRAELRLKNQFLKEYFDKKSDFDINQILVKLVDKEFLFDMFLYFSDRLLRFRDKRGEVYSVLEV